MKKIWILEHYAARQYIDKGGRHLWFAKELKKYGYETIIISASFLHKGNENIIEKNSKIVDKYCADIPFVFLRTNSYEGNGKSRIKNMFQFFYRCLLSAKKIEKKYGKPDIIIGSSVHPLTCIAGIILGKKYKCQIISEIKDLWPETLLMMGYVKENSILAKILYFGEKMIYKYSDKIIFSMEGGKQYIVDKGWNKEIDLNKVYYINNGIDLENFKKLEKNYFYDLDLENNKFKIMYTGTIAKSDNLKRIVDAADKLKKEKDIVFLIYGDGDEKEELEDYCKVNKINNIIFKNRVTKDKIPYILSKANLLLFNGHEKPESKFNIMKYGVSARKMFDYLASAKIILQTFDANYSTLKKYDCGIILQQTTSNEISNEILKIKNFSLIENEKYQKNCIKAVQEFDFKYLTKILVEVLKK